MTDHNDPMLFPDVSPTTAREARDLALADVSRPDFHDLVAEVVRSLGNREVTGEDIRLACEARGVQPHHHNAWGAAVSWLIKRGLLHDTGRFTRMKDTKSHARKTTLYWVEEPAIDFDET